MYGNSTLVHELIWDVVEIKVQCDVILNSTIFEMDFAFCIRNPTGISQLVSLEMGESNLY